jgi:hypothetical protein
MRPETIIVVWLGVSAAFLVSAVIGYANMIWRSRPRKAGRS